jgi:hypothetical protein
MSIEQIKAQQQAAQQKRCDYMNRIRKNNRDAQYEPDSNQHCRD